MAVYSPNYAQNDTLTRAARRALETMPGALVQGAALAAGSPGVAAVGYGYDGDGVRVDYYRVGDFIGPGGVRIAPDK